VSVATNLELHSQSNISPKYVYMFLTYINLNLGLESVEISSNLLILNQNRATDSIMWLDFGLDSVDFSRFPLIQVKSI